MTLEEWQQGVDICIELRKEGKGTLFSDGLAIQVELWPLKRNIVSHDTKVKEYLQEIIEKQCV